MGQFPFENIAQQSGLASLKVAYGVAIGDFNNDRYEDISLTFTSGPPKVFLNNKDGTYEDVTSTLKIDFTGNARTSLWVDIDNDGWLDLFVGGKSENSRLFQNIEGSIFTEVTNQYQLSNHSNIFSINVAEVNADPFLDIYLSNFFYPSFSNKSKAAVPFPPPHL